VFYDLVPRLPKVPRRKAIGLPRLAGHEDVGHVEINAEGYLYIYTPTFSLDFNPDHWEITLVFDRDDDPLPNEEDRTLKAHPLGWERVELFRGIPRDDEEALDHTAYVDDDEEGPVRWSSGEHVPRVVITYHYADVELPYSDRRRIIWHEDYESFIVPSIDGPLLFHIESWYDTES
jgi:hypothetical protein